MDDILKIKEIRFCYDEKEFLAKLRVEAIAKKIPIIDDATGFLLEVICLIKKPENILEIGCGTGYSTYFLIKELGNKSNYTGIDLNKERLETAQKFMSKLFINKQAVGNKYSKKIINFDNIEELEKNNSSAQIKSPAKLKNIAQNKNNGNLKRLKFLHGDALKIIPTLDQQFDFVFIDAAKYEYPEYIKSLINGEGKLYKNAIIIADNIFYGDKIFQTQVSKHDQNSVTGLRKYIELITTSSYFENYFLNIGDGVTLSVYRGI